MFTCDYDWLKESSLEETLSFLKALALKHAAQSGPFADHLTKCIGESDWHGLVDFSIDYAVGTPYELAHARQALAFFQKLECLPLGINTEDVAWESFKEAEEKCRLTNRRLRAARLDGTITPPGVELVILLAQRKISEALGPVPSLDELDFSFGPGATTTVKASASSARWKLDAQLECSHNLVPALPALLSALPLIADSHREKPGNQTVKSDSEHRYDDKTYQMANDEFLRSYAVWFALEEHMGVNPMITVSIVNGKLVFVVKNAKTKRSVVVEPPLNQLPQKGVGKYLKGRLRSIGLDLSKQEERNKLLARQASVQGHVATVDLKQASNTISLEAVKELYPEAWYLFLLNFRTSRVEYKGEVITLEMFSSMGNAFTFELETLMFWAIAWAVTRLEGENVDDVMCYGDDILLPTRCVPTLTKVLHYLGFELNLSKSFWEGRFRESCGGDYVSGFDIRPYYQKDLVSGQSLFVLHNFYMRTFQLEMAAEVLKAIPEELRLFGPDGYGDGHLIGDWHHIGATHKKHCDRGFSGVTFETYSLSKRSLKKRLRRGDALLPFYSIYVGGNEDPLGLFGESQPSDHFVVRGHKGYKRIKIYTHTTGVFCR
jgi:hypothetical protein